MINNIKELNRGYGTYTFKVEGVNLTESEIYQELREYCPFGYDISITDNNTKATARCYYD